MLTENKFNKYLLYAIGEIVLVVIGILIALQINNWNEDRKLNNVIDNLLNVFENELRHNIEESNQLIRRGYYKDSIIIKYVNNALTKEDLLRHQSIFNFQTNTKDFNNDNLDKLIELEKDLPEQYKSLVPELKGLKKRIESQRVWEAMVIDLAFERQKENADELPWLNENDSLSIAEGVNYYLTNPIFKNKILHFNDYDLNENTFDASIIRNKCVTLLWTLKNIRGMENTSIEHFLTELDLIPFQSQDCQVSLETNEFYYFRVLSIFYNNTEDIVFYNYLDLNGNILNTTPLSLEPKSFSFRGLRIGRNRYIQTLENDSCKRIYRRVNEDYLLFN